MSASVITPVIESQTPGHSDSINYNLISLSILFYVGKDTFSSCYMDKLIGVLLLQVSNSLPCVVLFHSVVPLNIASINNTILQTKNFIWPSSQLIWTVSPRPQGPQ